MPKFYQTEKFKRIEAQWKARLERGGFDDQEDENGHLRTYDRRTICWHNLTRYETYFRKVDQFLQENHRVPARHRKILELYSRGIKQTEITKELSIANTTVRFILAVYKEIIQAQIE